MQKLRIGLALVLALLAMPSFAPRAEACGGFFSRAAEGTRRPSLAYEQMLIVFDAAKRREHFVREVVFRTAREPFGFVVPAPARPEVAAVKKSPFADLRKSFPFEPPTKGFRLGGMGGGMPAGAVGVQVLEVSKVGSFTAFVLAADDAKALAGWLSKNGFSSTPQADSWLAHYVKLKFYYVAMRYEPPSQAADAGTAEPRTASETMRISFDTPLPYYPYFEPDPAPQSPPREPRLLDVWLVSKDAYVPVSAQTQGARVHWVRPLAAGANYDGNNREALARALDADAAILPSGTGEEGAVLKVQRFTIRSARGLVSATSCSCRRRRARSTPKRGLGSRRFWPCSMGACCRVCRDAFPAPGSRFA